MQIRSLTVGPIATCCYILSREDRPDCLVIDPGAEPERILRAAGEKRIAAILLTHGHFDHIEAVAAAGRQPPDPGRPGDRSPAHARAYARQRLLPY